MIDGDAIVFEGARIHLHEIYVPEMTELFRIRGKEAACG